MRGIRQIKSSFNSLGENARIGEDDVDSISTQIMNEEKVKAIGSYMNALEHIWVAYYFFYQTISKEDIRKKIPKVSFERYSQVESMIIELGWAFFCSMEASLEVLIHKLGAKSVQGLLEKESINDKFDDKDQGGGLVFIEKSEILYTMVLEIQSCLIKKQNILN